MKEVLYTARGMLLTAVINWIFNRRKHAADAGAAEIQNLHDIISEWEQSAKEWKRQLDEAHAQGADLIRQSSEEREKHRQEVTKLSDKIDSMRREMYRLRKALAAAGINIADEKQEK